MRRRDDVTKWIGGAVALLAAIAAIGCGDDEPAASATADAAQAQVVEDAKGERFETGEPVERIACMQTACDEILADLGLVPVATWVPEEMARYPVYFGDRAAEIELHQDEIDVEKVAATRPDLIYVREGQEKEARQLEKIAPVFTGFSGFETDPEQYKENVRDLGRLTGRTEQAEAAVRRWDATVARLRDAAPADATETTVFAQSGYEPRKYAGWFRGGIFCNVLERERLGRCALEQPDGAEDAYGEVSAEAVLKADPDLIQYQASPVYDVAPPSERTDPTWRRLKAVDEGKVFVDESTGTYCCGLREPAYALQLYAHHAFGAPDPGPFSRWRP
jgi:iron complex transport system substrate-binding protein